jgi:hypothetical protein
MKNSVFFSTLVIMSCAFTMPASVNAAEDTYEQEADNVAEKVLSRPAPAIKETTATAAANEAAEVPAAASVQSPADSAQKMRGPLGTGDCNPICGGSSVADEVSQPAAAQ